MSIIQFHTLSINHNPQISSNSYNHVILTLHLQPKSASSNFKTEQTSSLQTNKIMGWTPVPISWFTNECKRHFTDTHTYKLVNQLWHETTCYKLQPSITKTEITIQKTYKHQTNQNYSTPTNPTTYNYLTRNYYQKYTYWPQQLLLQTPKTWLDNLL